MNKPILILQPIHNSSADIMRKFFMGKPLSSEQVNFLYAHQKQLSDSRFDPVLKYYLETDKKRREKYKATFLLPHEKLKPSDIPALRKHIQFFLREAANRVAMQFTQQQFLQFKEYTIQDLIYWHGNQFLTGAPFYPGGIPPLIFFQWGNLFGIVKYLVLAEEKALKANILIYFEDMQDRDLNQCVQNYNKHLQNEMSIQNEILFENKIEPVEFDKFLIKPPVIKSH
ncbi:MAG: hypothetical protein A3E83_00705 [Gammaproteobacteria bacterium RIFCSPHIGHO2_12_FULL_41_20]|nr:MAG: hypothetical protein A3E83_00705 [Gammaproteobacteria bacterium RIFCSPHIGHO2_12_FULL_41_20]